MKVTRRSLLKTLTAGTGLAVAGVQLASLVRADDLIKGGRGVSRTTGTPRYAVPTTCLQCPARCGILGFVEERALVKIEGNPKDPNGRGRLCARGQAGINQLYNPDRLLYPVRRVGARGSGKWERITWEEAYQELAAKLKALRTAGQPEGLVFAAGLEGTAGVAGRFLRAFGTPNVLEELASQQSTKETAQRLTWGAGLDVNDVAHTKFILNFGANPYEAHSLHLPLMQRMVDGRMNGARLVTFDPRLSNTAVKSDQWIPIRPGTDGVVALAMANVIMQKGLYDRAFLETWTNYSPSKLIAHLSEYTLEVAERTSDVPASTIERLAVEFARTKPATTLSAGGVSGHANGAYNERAVALLNAITGNVDVRGGYCLPRTYTLAEPDPQPPALAAPSPVGAGRYPLAGRGAVQELFPAIKEGRLKVGVLLAAAANPVFASPQTDLAAEVLADEKLVPFYVVADTSLTESAALADIVLPAATYLESWDVQSVPAFEMVPFVSLTQPVVAPAGESVALPDIWIELARRIGNGLEKYFGFATAEQYATAAIATLAGLQKAGGLKYLRENGVWVDPDAEPQYRSYEAKGFATPSGKFEIYSERMEKAGLAPLPVYRPVAAHESMAKEEMVLIPFQHNVHTYSRTANSVWLTEIVHRNPVWIHPQTAQALGVHTGDHVRITSSAGSIEAQAWLTQGIRPDTLAIGDFGGNWETGRIARAQRFQSNDPNSALLWWEKHGNGVHPHRAIPIASEPVGGGQAWKDTKVSISKA